MTSLGVLPVVVGFLLVVSSAFGANPEVRIKALEKELAALKESTGAGAASDGLIDEEYPTGPTKTVSTHESYAAMAALYKATNGDNWKAEGRQGWMKGDPCANGWFGVFCDEDGHITTVALHNIGMTGTLPSEIGKLHHVEKMIMSHNAIGGTIPPEIGNLVNANRLSFAMNNLHGTIPESMGNLASVKHLVFSSNSLTGTLPDSLGKLEHMQDLHFSMNQLEGTVPESIGKLPHLKDVNLHTNKLEGLLPKGLLKLPNLQYVVMYGNDLRRTEL